MSETIETLTLKQGARFTQSKLSESESDVSGITSEIQIPMVKITTKTRRFVYITKQLITLMNIA